MSKDESFVTVLHSDRNLSDKKINWLWNYICEYSDGVDVEHIRLTLGIDNTIHARRKTIEGLQYVSKSKQSKFKWDAKYFQFFYMFGLTGKKDPDAARIGRNNHYIMEMLPKTIDKQKMIQIFENTQDITKYVYENSEKIFIDSILESEPRVPQSIKKLDDAVNIFSKSEVDGYVEAFNKIALNYQRRFSNLYDIHKNYDMVLRLFFPLYAEIKILDLSNWLIGVVDGIYPTIYSNIVKPVDYKFGAPKAKYYMEAIELEMAFYQKLIMAANAVYEKEESLEDDADDIIIQIKDQKYNKWNPMFCGIGEMWHLMDPTINGMNSIEFNKRVDKIYNKAVVEYWNAMETMSYNFQRNYGYLKDRFIDFCEAKENNAYKCEYRSVCNQSNSFRMENNIGARSYNINMEDVAFDDPRT